MIGDSCLYFALDRKIRGKSHLHGTENEKRAFIEALLNFLHRILTLANCMPGEELTVAHIAIITNSAI